jgi:hypothetical protein
MTRPKVEVAAEKSAHERNLEELRETRDALADAIEALKMTMKGPHPAVRVEFINKVRFALTRLTHVAERLMEEGAA